MKYIFLFTLFLYSCGSTAQLQKENTNEDKPVTEKNEEQTAIEEIPFEFTKATSQKFSGGAPGSGSTTMLSVFLKKLTDGNLEFSKIWLSNDKPYYLLKLKRKQMEDNWSNYKADDELILFATNRNNNPLDEAEKAKSVEDKMPPYQFASDALIEYLFNDELMYFEVPSLEKLQDVNAK